jgi:hypothetical protein
VIGGESRATRNPGRLRLEPNDATNYGNTGNASVILNRLEEAETVYRQAEEHKLEGEVLLLNR